MNHPCQRAQSSLSRPLEILYSYYTERLATLVVACVDFGDHTTEGQLTTLRELLTVVAVTDFGTAGVAQMAQHDGILVERMCTEVNADELLLLA